MDSQRLLECAMDVGEAVFLATIIALGAVFILSLGGMV